MYIHMHIHVHAKAYIHITQKSSWSCAYSHYIYVCVYVFLSIYMVVYMFMYIYTYTQNMRMHTCKLNVYTHMCIDGYRCTQAHGASTRSFKEILGVTLQGLLKEQKRQQHAATDKQTNAQASPLQERRHSRAAQDWKPCPNMLSRLRFVS